MSNTMVNARSKEPCRKILEDIVVKFCEDNDWEGEQIDRITEDSEAFYDYLDEHEDLKDKMFEFFQTLLDDYSFYRFHNEPIPALIDSEHYMSERKKGIEEEAENFFNFGPLFRKEKKE